MSDAQKHIKLKVMDKLMDALPSVIRENPDVTFDNRSLTDLVISCVCMYVRDQLTHFFLNSNALGKQNETMDSLFIQIKKEVNLIIDAETKVNDKRSLN